MLALHWSVAEFVSNHGSISFLFSLPWSHLFASIYTSFSDLFLKQLLCDNSYTFDWLTFWNRGKSSRELLISLKTLLWSRTCNNKHLPGYVFVIWRNMASSSQDTYMDAYLFAIACNYDKFRLLDLNASDVEKRLLQSIRDDADEADLKEYLTSTLLKITDEANEESGKFTMTV